MPRKTSRSGLRRSAFGKVGSTQGVVLSSRATRGRSVACFPRRRLDPRLRGPASRAVQVDDLEAVRRGRSRPLVDEPVAAAGRGDQQPVQPLRGPVALKPRTWGDEALQRSTTPHLTLEAVKRAMPVLNASGTSTNRQAAATSAITLGALTRAVPELARRPVQLGAASRPNAGSTRPAAVARRRTAPTPDRRAPGWALRARRRGWR
jgi:hypothetical protein